MIQKLIDYIQSKVSIEVKLSETTNSRYINLGKKVIRISDHLPAFSNKKIDVVVIVPETPKNFIISIGYKVYCYTSLRRTGDFLVDYILFNNNIEDKYSKLSQDIIQKQEKEINELKGLVQELQTLSNFSDKDKLKRQAEEITRLHQKQSEIKTELKEKDVAIKEAVNLIETLTTDPDARPLLYSKQGKKYYLDNFPDDAREMIEELIREYYSK